MRRALAALAAILFASQALAEAVIGSGVYGGDNAAPPAAVWNYLPTGAGGYVTGIDSCSDGTLVVRTDSANAYKWNSSTSQWNHLFTRTTLAGTAWLSTNYPLTTGDGTEEIKIAPSSCGVMYANYEAAMWKSTNGGSTWTQLTGFPAIAVSNANATWRMFNNNIAIDPSNPNYVWVGYCSAKSGGNCSAESIAYTQDGGATWTTLVSSGITAPTTFFYYNITFDPTTCTTTCSGLYIASWNGGMWYSANANTGSPTFTQITSANTPTKICSVSANGLTGVLAVVSGCTGAGGKGTGVWTYSGQGAGTWTALTGGAAGGANFFTWNPGNWNQLVGIAGQFVFVSYDGGATWTASENNAATVTYALWQSQYPHPGGGTADGRFIPGTQTLLAANGAGVWSESIPTSAGNPTANWLDDHIKGIENLTSLSVAIPPGSVGGTRIIATSWDFPDFLTNISTPASACFPNNGQPCNGSLGAVNDGMGRADWIAGVSDAAFMPAGPWTSATSQFTTNWGSSVTSCAAFPTNASRGAGAAGDTSTFVYDANLGSAATAQYTQNGCAAWTAITSGLCAGFAETAGDAGKTVAADRVNTDIFYIYERGHGMWQLDLTGTPSCTRLGSFTVIGQNAQGPVMKTVPGQAGQLFFHSYSGNKQPLLRTTISGGTTAWTTVSTVTWASCMGFGKAEATYPTIIIYGNVPAGSDNAGVGGVSYWESTDNAVTWTNLGTGDDLLMPWDCEGDPSNTGWFYSVLPGHSFYYYH